jgi:putative ABC transport system permease protein
MIPIKYNLRSLLVRRATSAMTALGVGLVVMILFILLGFIAGLRATMLNSGGRNNWIVVSRAVNSEPASEITREQYEIIRTRPEIAADSSGAALLSPEIVAAFNPRADGRLDESIFTYLRGVYPIAYRVHRAIRLASGRFPAPGKYELLVGIKLAARTPELALGRTIHLGRDDWTVVGTFSDDGSARESEVWTDLDLLAQAIHFGTSFSSLHLVMKPAMGDSFRAALQRDARLALDAEPEREFYAAQTRLADRLRDLGLAVAVILGIGAAFGGMNTMYASVARRAREVGVLRALGFSRGQILASFVAESVLVAVIGGVAGEILGVAVAYVTGLQGRLMTVESFIFSFRLAPSAFAAGLVAAALIGAAGGLLPAWRAARIGVVEALREA